MPNIQRRRLSQAFARATRAMLGMVAPRDAARTTTVGAATSKSGTKGDSPGDEVGNMTSAQQKTAPIPIATANSTSTATTATARGSSAVSPPSSTSPASSVTHNGTISGSRRSRERRRGTVQMEEIPGTRSYEILETEEDVWKELRTLARPHRAVFVNERGVLDAGDNQGDRTPNGDGAGRYRPAAATALISVADSVNFQPCRNLKTQDRYVVTQLDIHGEIWTLTGVFDGHMGDVTVEHVAHHLPIIIRDFIKKELPPRSSGSSYDPDHVARLFKSAIAAFDDAIAHDVLDLFGGSIDKLKQYSDNEIRAIINDAPALASGSYGAVKPEKFGDNWRKARLCMYGTTALVALVGPKSEGLWVANLGDCTGVLVTNTVTVEDDLDGSAQRSRSVGDEGEWTVDVLTTMHNGDNDEEIARIMKEHPGEEESCIVDRRVLGALAPTRCLGDIPFKQPTEFTRRILYNLYPFVHNTAPWEDFLSKNLSPPYISADAEVVYRDLKAEPLPAKSRDDANEEEKRMPRLLQRLSSARSKKKTGKKSTKKVVRHRFLVLASDGFMDLCSTNGGMENIVKSWAQEMVQINTPTREIEDIRAKLDERDKVADAAELASRPPPAPPIGLAIDTSVALTQTPTSSPDMRRDRGPVSPTSPVPFTGASTYHHQLWAPKLLPPTAQPTVLPATLPVTPKTTKPPLPRTNKSYHCTSTTNMAMRLLRRALGGEERSNDRVSKVLTVDMDVSWVDDTAIVVLSL
ncbi:phosphatase 2C-like domain-containing protein [Coprinopsis sp. MPI-PUGE-AT-0042]|nr:phosphatase 2C-like domain-containing protein [Coprinopsis sp. MPI-PUGE-AT-0042]